MRASGHRKWNDKIKCNIKKWYLEGVKPEFIADRLGVRTEDVLAYIESKKDMLDNKVGVING